MTEVLQLDKIAAQFSPERDVATGKWFGKPCLKARGMKAVQAVRAARVPAFYAHHDPDWRTLNARLVAEHKRDDFADLLASVEDSHRQLIDLLGTIPAEEFDQDYGVRFKGYKVTIARLLLSETKDERKHHGQIQAFARRRSKGVPGL